MSVDILTLVTNTFFIRRAINFRDKERQTHFLAWLIKRVNDKRYHCNTITLSHDVSQNRSKFIGKNALHLF